MTCGLVDVAVIFWMMDLQDACSRTGCVGCWKFSCLEDVLILVEDEWCTVWEYHTEYKSNDEPV